MIRAIGLQPSLAAVDSRISTRAAAPSEMLDALAAVIVAGHHHRRDLPGEAAVGVGLHRALGRGDGELVLRLAREGVLGHALLGEHAHRLAALVGVLQPVERHVVVGGDGAVAVALARIDQQVRGVGHALHSAGDHHVRRTGHQHVVREHHRAHAGAAHLAERHRAGRLRQPGGERGLARRRLALAGHQAAAHQHFVDRVALDPGALDRRLDGDGAELPGLQG
jgi:hypothetical protein